HDRVNCIVRQAIPLSDPGPDIGNGFGICGARFQDHLGLFDTINFGVDCEDRRILFGLPAFGFG
ncbi:hypothetical protein, partial [Aeromonas veronii]|uniref:hypothetical protein n=1 Tax=Aeromonas veronii TaxID=654 RepID=UPI00406D3F55